MNKKILSLVIALVMIFGSVTSVMAAEFDLIHKLDSSKNTNILEFMDDIDVYEQVTGDFSNYEIEYEGEKYSVVDVDAKLKDGAKDLAEAIEQLKGEAPEELKVVEVSAINAKTLKVEFNGAIAEEDQADVTFDVKRGTIATTVEATWAEDGKSVELARATNLLAGTYTVTVGGLEFAEGANVGTVEVTAQKIAKLEIVSDNVVRDGAAKLDYKVYDQYGEELTRNATTFNWTVVNMTDITRVAEANPGAFAYLEIDTDGSDTSGNGIVSATGADVGDVLRITGLLASDPTVKAVKEVTVSNIFVNSFEFGAVVLPEGETRLNEATAPYNVEISYAALDNYGNNVNLAAGGPAATVDNITFISSKPALIPATATVDAKGKLTFQVLANQSGKATITALNNNTGETSSIVLEVFASAYANTVEFGEAMIIEGDATTYELPVTFFDQYGEEIAADDMIAYTLATDFNVAVIPSATDLVLNDLSADGKNIVFTTANEGTYTLTLTNKTTGVQSSTTVEVNEARVPNELVVETAPQTTLVAGENATVKFKVIDQYGEEMTGAEPEAANYQLVATKTSGLDAKLIAPTEGTTYAIGTAAGNAMADITITAGAAGKETITFTLEETGSNAIDSQAFEITVVADAADFNVTTDKEEYTAGDDVVVTVKAADANGDFYNKYNETQTATISLRAASLAGNPEKTYIRTLNFVDGVATATVPATLADDIDVRVSFGGSDYDMGADYTAGDIEVKVAEMVKFAIDAAATDTDFDITAQDAYGNTITTFTGSKVMVITVDRDGTPVAVTGADSENNVVVTFKDGAALSTNGNAVGVAALAADDVITVTYGDYTGTLTVK